MGAGDTFLFYDYHSDDLNTYSIKLSAVVAAQGGFSGGAVNPASLAWPYHYRDLRHVNGKIVGTSKHARLPISNANNALYTSGGSFTLAAGTYLVQGSEGERQ